MTTTFEALNNRQEIRRAVDGLFGDEAQWVHDYFETGSIPSGFLGLGGSSDRQRAFSEGMTEMLRSLLRDGDNRTIAMQIRPHADLSVMSHTYYGSDGRINLDQFREMMRDYSISKLELPQRMGEDYWKFEQLAIGLLNGLYDKDRADAYTPYSIDEFDRMFAVDFIEHLYRPLTGPQFDRDLNEAIRVMNSLCGPIQEQMDDALPIPSAPGALQRNADGSARR